jgi:hypothetical protein
MITTKNITVGNQGGNVGPLIRPGVHKVKIYDLYAEKPGYVDNNAPDKLNVNLRLETEPIEGLTGWDRDRNNPSLGIAEGQIGIVSLNPYGFSSRKLPDGTVIDRDTSILRILKALANAKGVEEEIDLIEARTIEEFVAMAKSIICDDTYIHMVIGGKKSAANGYYKYYLDVASPKGRKGKAFSTNPDELFEYDESKDIYITQKAKDLAAEKAAEQQPVQGFNTNSQPQGDAPFNL